MILLATDMRACASSDSITWTVRKVAGNASVTVEIPSYSEKIILHTRTAARRVAAVCTEKNPLRECMNFTKGGKSVKAVLLSIQPKWCELIASGEKTVEVRKTKPKLETPFKCYIYETKDKQFEHIGVVGYRTDGTRYDFLHGTGKVIGEFICDKVIDIHCRDLTENFRRLVSDIIAPSRLKVDKLKNYLGFRDGYGWHISDLKIYDKPKDLNEFYPYCEGECTGCKYLEWVELYGSDACMRKRIKRPPQSWCYVDQL